MPPAGPEEPEPAKTAFLVGLAEPLRGALGELLTVRRRRPSPPPPSPALERWPPAPRCCRPRLLLAMPARPPRRARDAGAVPGGGAPGRSRVSGGRRPPPRPAPPSAAALGA